LMPSSPTLLPILKTTTINLINLYGKKKFKEEETKRKETASF
jgi:hypothetical protein